MFSTEPVPLPVTPDQRALRQVDRAITDLRRGCPVLLRDGKTALLVQAAEAIAPESLERLRTLAGQPLSLVLTRRRAAALGLAEPPSGKGGAVLLRLGAETAAAELRDLADPGAEAIPHPQAGPATAASQAADAAVELVKLARLLPAVVAAPAQRARRGAARRARGADAARGGAGGVLSGGGGAFAQAGERGAGAAGGRREHAHHRLPPAATAASSISPS